MNLFLTIIKLLGLLIGIAHSPVVFGAILTEKRSLSGFVVWIWALSWFMFIVIQFRLY